MKPKMTATILRGLGALARQARLMSATEFVGSEATEARIDWRAALAAVDWIKAITPPLCATCNKPLSARSVLGQDNKLRHSRCADRFA